MASFLALGRYLAEQVKEYDSTTFYNPPEDDLWGVGSTHIPSIGDLPRGLQAITYFRREVIGRAAVSLGAYDIPMISSRASKDDAIAVNLIATTEWSQDELDAYQFAQSRNMMPGDNLIQTNIADVSLAINRRLHEIAMVGLPEINLYGLFNSPAITTVDDSATQVYSLTSAQLLDWWQAKISNFKKISKLPYSSIVAYVSDDMIKILSKRFADSTGDSPIQSIKSSDRGVYLADIVPLAELDAQELNDLGLGITAQEYVIIGDLRNRQTLKKRFNTMRRTEPFPKDTGYHYGLTGSAGTTSLIVTVPERIQRIKYGATKP